MTSNTKIAKKKYTCTCMECKNSIDVELSKKNGDVVECKYCGVEYEVFLDANGTKLRMLEEEK